MDYYNEKLNSEINREIYFFRSQKKQKTEKSYLEDNRKRRGNICLKSDSVPDLDVKIIVNYNNNSKIDSTEFKSRERNKTI